MLHTTLSIHLSKKINLEHNETVDKSLRGETDSQPRYTEVRTSIERIDNVYKCAQRSSVQISQAAGEKRKLVLLTVYEPLVLR